VPLQVNEDNTIIESGQEQNARNKAAANYAFQKIKVQRASNLSDISNKTKQTKKRHT